MRDGDIDYSRYSLAELREALSGIDRGKYPQNDANLRAAYRRLVEATPPEGRATEAAATEEPGDAWPGPAYDEDGRYVPNSIPPAERAWHVGLSLLLLACGGHGVLVNDLYIPGKRSRGVHLHDVPAWIMYGAMICACLVMLSVVIDHYDRRDNERRYRTFAKFGGIAGWTLFGASLAWRLAGDG
jgi:hypothetical protein